MASLRCYGILAGCAAAVLFKIVTDARCNAARPAEARLPNYRSQSSGVNLGKLAYVPQS